MTRKILIVEDHADIRRLIRMTLEFENYEIHEAADGAAGLDAVRRLKPDVVLLDVMMPGGLDGLEACRRIQGDAALDGVRVVLLTARGQRQEIEAGLGTGADAYLVKPFSPLHLIETIGALMGAAGAAA